MYGGLLLTISPPPAVSPFLQLCLPHPTVVDYSLLLPLLCTIYDDHPAIARLSLPCPLTVMGQATYPTLAWTKL